MEDKQTEALNEFLKTIIEKQGTDVLFECFAGLIAGSKIVPSDNIHVIPRESYRRSHRTDIIHIPRVDKYDPESYVHTLHAGCLNIYTSRSAILDYLPEDFYNEADNRIELLDEFGNPRPKEEIKLVRERRKRELESAQQFFVPLEVEYNKVRIQRELSEVENLENLDGLLEELWQQFPLRDERWRRFVRTLHLVAHVVGDLEKTKSLIEYVLGKPVELIWEVEEYYKMSDEEQNLLTGEKLILGFNTNMGNTVYDYQELCLWKVEELSSREFYDYFDEDTESRQLLEAMKKYYFPLNVEVRLDFAINPAKCLAEGEEKAIVLGYSSKLED